MTAQTGPWPKRASGTLRVVSWAAPVVAAVWLRIAHWSSAQVPSGLVVGVLALLFACLVARVVLAGVAAPGRRVTLSSLTAGLIFWAAGSAVLNAAAPPDAVRFPAPGEWLFLAGYVGFSAFLVLDRAGTSGAGPGGFLDAVIVMGGTACVALVVLVTPLTAQLGDRRSSWPCSIRCST